jgi:tetratricopeptide (TPR) repeat protein
MATQPHDPNDPHPDHEHQPPPADGTHAHDAVHAEGADAGGAERGPKTDARKQASSTDPSQPTMIMPYGEGGREIEEPPVVPHSYVQGHPAIPNLSLDEPHHAKPGPAEENVLEDEPVLAQDAADSPIIEAAEVAEAVPEVPSDIHDIFIDEPGHVGSSVVEVAEVASDVEDAEVLVDEAAHEGSSVVSANALIDDSSVEIIDATSAVEEAAPAEAVPASDAVVIADEAAEEAPAAAVADVTPAPATPPPVLDEDLIVSDFLNSDTPTKPAPAAHVAEDVVDLDSDPEIQLAHPSGTLDKEKEPTAPEDVEADINWDDVPTLGDSKVTKQPAEPDETLALAAKADEAAHVVHEDEVSFEDVDDEDEPSAPTRPSAKAPAQDAAAHDNEVIFEEEIGAEPAPMKKEIHRFADEVAPAAHKAATAADAEEIGAEALLDDEPASKSAAPDEHTAAALLHDEDAEDKEAAIDEAAEEPAPKKKGKKKDDDDGAGASVARPIAKPVAKPRYGRRVLVGAGLATLLLAGVFVGVWYLKPNLLDDFAKASPAYEAPKKTVPKGTIQANAPRVQARVEMENGQFDNAIKRLKDADDPASLSTRAEARWLKYLQKQTRAKQKLDKNSDEVKKVLAELKEANNDLLTAQVKAALEGGGAGDGAGNDKAVAELKERAEKAEAAKKDADDQLAAAVADSKKGNAKLLAAKKEADEKLDAINKALADAKIKGDSVKGLEELIAARNQAAKERDELDLAVKSAYKELSGEPADADARAKLVEAAKSARQRTESPLTIPLTGLGKVVSAMGIGAGSLIGKGFDAAAVSAELAFYRLREPLLTTPDRKMDTYIGLLAGSGRDPAHLKQAAREAGWVLSKEAKSTPEARAKAHIVIALADREQGDFESAKKNLTEAIKLGGDKDAAWVKSAAASLSEITDAGAYYLPRAEKQVADGNLKAAQETLNQGLKALPGNPRLLGLRGLVRLEAANGNKKLIQAAEQQIRQDAQAAAADAEAAAQAAYVLGMLDEELGNFEQAEASYRQAIKSHKGNAEEANRYIIALARLLQRERAAGAAPAAPPQEAPANPKKDDADNSPEAAAGNDGAQLTSLRAILTLAVVGVAIVSEDEEPDPATAARIQESIELANKLIQSANPKTKGEGHMILGQALSKSGKRTEGMKEYVRGLQLLFPGAASRDLAKLLEEQFAIQQSEAPATNPALAEQLYGKGLNLFWARSYAEAESKFKEAAEHYPDARYQYFLGLSLLNQAKRTAADAAFQQGARLESANRPGMGEVNASLERIQGPTRTFVDSFRQKVK